MFAATVGAERSGAAGCRQPKAGAGQRRSGAERVAGRVGVFGWLAREGWKVRRKRSASQKSNPLRGTT